MECRPVFSWIHPQNYKLSLVAGISAIAATLILLCMGVGKLVKAYYPIVDNELSGSSIRKLVQSKTAKKISRRNLKKSMLLKEE